ncbi:MAG: bifunctional nuclease domain-containing protein [Acidobacteriota bacterium]
MHPLDPFRLILCSLLPALLLGLGAPGVAALGAEQGDSEAVVVHIAGLRAIGPEQVLLLLADEAEERAVPIAVGRDQGIAIYLGREGTKTPRPMTHDLMVRILEALGARVERVTVTALRSDTYYAELSIRIGRKRHAIDARPSDAVALAVRLDAPIFVAADLLRPLDATEEQPELFTRTDRRLGLSVQRLDRDLAEFLGAAGVSGVLVSAVANGGTADRAGVRRGDVLREIDGRPTATLKGYREAIDQAADGPRFTVWRDGRELTLSGG